MIPSIRKSLVTNDGIDGLRNGNQRLRLRLQNRAFICDELAPNLEGIAILLAASKTGVTHWHPYPSQHCTFDKPCTAGRINPGPLVGRGQLQNGNRVGGAKKCNGGAYEKSLSEVWLEMIATSNTVTK